MGPHVPWLLVAIACSVPEDADQEVSATPVEEVAVPLSISKEVTRAGLMVHASLMVGDPAQVLEANIRTLKKAQAQYLQLEAEQVLASQWGAEQPNPTTVEQELLGPVLALRAALSQDLDLAQEDDVEGILPVANRIAEHLSIEALHTQVALDQEVAMLRKQIHSHPNLSDPMGAAPLARQVRNVISQVTELQGLRLKGISNILPTIGENEHQSQRIEQSVVMWLQLPAEVL